MFKDFPADLHASSFYSYAEGQGFKPQTGLTLRVLN